MGKFKALEIGWQKYWVEFGCVLLSVSFTILSYVIPGQHSDQDWFARSGSIMVLAALFGEYHLQKKNAKKYVNNAVRAGLGRKTLEFSNAARAANTLLLIMAIVGTVIWGYGDKILP